MRERSAAILIVDHDVRFATFAGRLFERAGYSAATASTGSEGVAAARAERPGLVLLEVCLPDINGFEVCRQLRDEFGEGLPIVFVSGERTEPLDRAAGLLVGGDDFLVKPCHPDELLARVRRLISRSDNGRLSWHRLPGDASLTRRELEVLRRLAAGRRPREIADDLFISPKTVSNHIQKVLAKLGAHSSAEAVAIAYREGFDKDADVTAHSLSHVHLELIHDSRAPASPPELSNAS